MDLFSSVCKSHMIYHTILKLEKHGKNISLPRSIILRIIKYSLLKYFGSMQTLLNRLQNMKRYNA